jgi:hypothetical protein
MRRFNDIKYTHYVFKIKAKSVLFFALKNECPPAEGSSFSGVLQVRELRL